MVLINHFNSELTPHALINSVTGQSSYNIYTSVLDFHFSVGYNLNDFIYLQDNYNYFFVYFFTKSLFLCKGQLFYSSILDFFVKTNLVENMYMNS